MPTPDRSEYHRARRAADLAARTATTLDALADRLPDYEPRVAFPALWSDLRNVRGIVGQRQFYDLLTSLDGAHLADDLIVRIAHHERAARRSVVIRPRRTPAAQREYLTRYLRRGRVHPPAPISYNAAHKRVAEVRGPAASHSCAECGSPAAEWSYSGFSPDEQTGLIVTTESTTFRAWSPNPDDYSPLCWLCHAEYDEAGVVWAEA